MSDYFRLRGVMIGAAWRFWDGLRDGGIRSRNGLDNVADGGVSRDIRQDRVCKLLLALWVVIFVRGCVSRVRKANLVCVPL